MCVTIFLISQTIFLILKCVMCLVRNPVTSIHLSHPVALGSPVFNDFWDLYALCSPDADADEDLSYGRPICSIVEEIRKWPPSTVRNKILGMPPPIDDAREQKLSPVAPPQSPPTSADPKVDSSGSSIPPPLPPVESAGSLPQPTPTAHSIKQESAADPKGKEGSHE